MMSQRPASPQGQRLIQWATMLAGVSLVLVVVNIVLAIIDQNAQAEVNQRQQQIAQAAQLEAVTNVLARELQAAGRQRPADPGPAEARGAQAPIGRPHPLTLHGHRSTATARGRPGNPAPKP